MKEFALFSLAALLSLSLSAGSVFAQQGPKPKIAEAQARATALAQVPGVKVQAKELENENGKLIYSYELKISGKSRIEEINVDAMTGRVLSKEHEGAKVEKAESRKEKKRAERQ